MNLEKLVRRNIWKLKPYSSARDEFKGEASAFLDANENPLRDNYNRYPDPLQWKLKEKVSEIKKANVKNIFLGNGSDEPIDLVIRVFCEPKVDNIVAIDPTYGMYQVCADVNDVEYRKVLLNDKFDIDASRLLMAADENTKVVFLCSPNNPSGNLLSHDELRKIITSFNGIVVLDEAYIDFAPNKSWLPELAQYPNLVILQTFSKAWGLAAVRLGMAFASEEIIQLLNKVKYPYNVNQLTQEFVASLIDNDLQKNEWVEILLRGRALLNDELKNLPIVEQVYPTDSNFILVRVRDANKVYQELADRGVIVRNRNSVSLCGNCLRITVGTERENKELLESMKEIG